MAMSARPLAPKTSYPKSQGRLVAHSRGSSTSSTPPRSKRGAPKFELNPEVAKCITKLVNCTAVPFGKLAEALENAEGPEKQWLRDFMGRISGVARFSEDRLKSLCPKDAKAREALQRQAIAASKKAGVEAKPRAWSTSSSPIEARRYAQPRAAHPKTQSPLQTGDPTNQGRSRRSSIRIGTSGGGIINQEQLGTPTPISPSSPTATRMKRPFPRETKGKEPLSYSERSNRTRNVSAKAFTETLGNATREHDLYDYIGRRCSAVAASVISHFSPRKRYSGETNATNDQSSPEIDERTRIRYVPDPDYEQFYHRPKADRIQFARSTGALAVSHLMQAQASQMTDEQAEAELTENLPSAMDDRKSYVRHADDNTVTALHLAVAYGYPRVCNVLLSHGADSRALTRRQNSACRFARPAEDMVGTDMPLYYRITICRTFICSGRPPPVPRGNEDSSGSSENGYPHQKRIKTVATPPLAVVREAPHEDPPIHNQYTQPQPIRPSIEETTLTPWLNNCGIHENFSDLAYYFGQPITPLQNGDVLFQPPEHSQASHGSDSQSPMPLPYTSVGASGYSICHGMEANALGITSIYPQYYDTSHHFDSSNYPDMASTLYPTSVDFQRLDQPFNSPAYPDNGYLLSSDFGLQNRTPILQERNQNQNYAVQNRDPTPYFAEAERWPDCPAPYIATQTSSQLSTMPFQQTRWPDKENETYNGDRYYNSQRY